jgi:protein TonB
MNFTERNNYIIAIFVSLIIHFSLLIIHVSDIPVRREPEIKTFPVGLVEISSESKSRQLSVALNTPRKEPSKNQAAAEEMSVKNPEKQSLSNERTEMKSVEPTQPSKDPDLFSEKEEAKVSDALVKKPENQSLPSGDAGHAEQTTDTENLVGGEPQSFGTGEAMVKIFGPMPTYPPAALREGIEGEVTIRILVNADGQLDLPIVYKTSGDVRLDYAATSSIEGKWKFTSINKGYYIDLTFSFDLHTKVSVKFIASKTR